MSKIDKERFLALIADIQAGNGPQTSFQQQASAVGGSKDMTLVLTEDMVTDFLEKHLVSNRWKIISRARGRQHGIDLVAERDGTRLEVEAKGAGTSTSGSGKKFSQTQVFTHVGEAVLKALQFVSAERAQAAIALPDNHDHQLQVERIRSALRRLGIIVFWVREDGAVTMEGAAN